MLEREIKSQFKNWLESSEKTALLVEGARQTGKTTLIREFAKENFQIFVEINFVTQEEAKEIFSDTFNPDTLISRITAFTHTELVPGKTLVFLDEIQECPRAHAAIKFLVDDGRFRYVMSGSLLGIKLKKIPSVPVGYVTELRMFPMNIREYFKANGVTDKIISSLESSYKNQTSVDPVIHDTLNKLFWTYLVVGGMPAVVQNYVSNHDIAAVIRMQNDIIRQYRQDISQYAEEKDRESIMKIFDLIPSELSSKNRRFVIADLKKEARYREYKDNFNWLTDAGVALPCFNVSEPAAPLKLNEQASLLKLYMNDTGLLCAAGMEDVQFQILKGDLSANIGSVLENLFAQEFASHLFSLRFFNRRSMGELDFLLQNEKGIIPVEIKSGNDYKKHTALDNVMNSAKWPLQDALIFCKGNVEKNGRNLYLPLYMAMFLERKTVSAQNMIYQVDLSGLN